MPNRKGIASLTLVVVLALTCLLTLVRCDMQHAAGQIFVHHVQETP